MKDVTNDDDVRGSRHATRSRGRVLKIEIGKTAVYLLDSKYEDGFSHWVKLPSGDITRVACAGGTEAGGYAPEVCPICAVCKEQYRQAREMGASGRKESGDRLREATNRIKGKYEMYFLAAHGDLTLKGVEGGDNSYDVDFTGAQVGLLSLTKKQREDLLALPSVRTDLGGTRGLLNRYIIIDKRVRDQSDYATLEFEPATKPTPRPEVIYDETEINLDGLFTVNLGELKKIAAILNGSEEEVGEVDFEDETPEPPKQQESPKPAPVAETPAPVAANIIEFPPKDDPAPKEGDEVESKFDDSFLDDLDDDFEDDLPWESEKKAVQEKKPEATSELDIF